MDCQNNPRSARCQDSYVSKFSVRSAFSPHAHPDEDWTKISDLAERRRLQNRIAQRSYRKKLKKRLEDQQRQATSSPEHSPDEGERSPVKEEFFQAESSAEQPAVIESRFTARMRAPSSSSPPANFQLMQVNPVYTNPYDTTQYMNSTPMLPVSPYATYPGNTLPAPYSEVIPNIYDNQPGHPEASHFYPASQPEEYRGVDINGLTHTDFTTNSAVATTTATTMSPYMRTSDPVYHYGYTDMYPMSGAGGTGPGSGRY